MPKRFNLSYVNAEGKEEQPIVIHRSSIGAIERVMAFLIEHYAGAFPLWLAPIQIAFLPIADRHIAYAQELNTLFINTGIRAETIATSETLQAKIRSTTLQKVPFMGIIGDREVENKSISLRTRKGEDLKSQSLENFLSLLQDQLEHRI